MLEEEFKGRTRNLRRGARATLVFRVCAGIVMAGLLIVVMRVSSALGEVWQEVEEVKAQVAGLPTAAPAPAPVRTVNTEELKGLSASLEALRQDMARAWAKSAEDLANAERAAAAERLRMTEELAALKAGARVAPVTPPRPTLGEVKPKEEVPAAVDAPETVEVPERGAVPETVELPVVVDEPVPEEGPEYESYTIRGGDTISEIARKYKVSMDEILKLNGITDVRKIQIGQVLKIPK